MDLFATKWGQVDLSETNHPGFLLPSPLLAIDQTQVLVGGLAFSSFAHPKSQQVALWINALLVMPEHRHKGIASRLIDEAEAQAKSGDSRELFVLTDVPDLYQQRGWQMVESAADGKVLTKILPGGQQVDLS